MIQASGRLDWWREQKKGLDILAKLAKIKQKTILTETKGFFITVLPDNRVFGHIDGAIQYLASLES
jgi:hypothetical protein